MARYIDNRVVFSEGYWRRKRCLELGSGCGLVSAVLARRGARVLATDKEIVLHHLNENLASNDVLHTTDNATTTYSVAVNGDSSSSSSMPVAGKVMTEELKWGPTATHPEAPFDVVIAAACLYVPKTVPILLQTLWRMSGPQTLLLMCGIVGEGALTAFLEQVDGYFSYTVRDDDGGVVEDPTRGDVATRMMVLVRRERCTEDGDGNDEGCGL